MGLIGYAEAFVGLYGPKPIEEKLKMNERIKELAVKVGCKVMDDGEWYIPTATGLEKIVYTKGIGLEKFAELIVRECMRMCDVAAIGYDSHGHTKEGNGCAMAREYIKEHFGVEE